MRAFCPAEFACDATSSCLNEQIGGEEWYIEGVLEELDIGREWFFDNQTLMLYYKPNSTTTEASAGSPPTGEFVATAMRVLLNVTGTQATPAHHIAIKGLTIRDTTYSYFEPHGLPSGGDWGEGTLNS